MSDYLSHIAARSLNLTTVIQPRLASLFEPLPNSIHLPNVSLESAEEKDADLESESTDEFQSPEVPAPATSPPASSPLSRSPAPTTSPPASSPLSRSPAPATSPPASSPLSRSPAPVTSPLAAPPLSTPIPNSPVSSVAHSSPMNPENTTGVTAASSSLASTEASRSPNPELTIQQIQQPWVQSQAVLAQPSASEPLMPKVPQPELASLPESRSLLPPRPVIQPQITALPEQPTSPPSTKPTSPPTIQVTIGRIDVRTIAAPTPSRRPSTPSPAKLSLDEYLRSRSSGASRKGGGSS